jgi:hypothetical protein
MRHGQRKVLHRALHIHPRVNGAMIVDRGAKLSRNQSESAKQARPRLLTRGRRSSATAVGTALLAAFAIGVVGLVVTVIQLNRRKAGWPFAVATFVLCALAVVLGGVGSAMAVGG